jgi:hypothetical protein
MTNVMPADKVKGYLIDFRNTDIHMV